MFACDLPVLDAHAPPVQFAFVGGNVSRGVDAWSARAQVKVGRDAAEREIEPRLSCQARIRVHACADGDVVDDEELLRLTLRTGQLDAFSQRRGSLDLGFGAARERDGTLLLGEPVSQLRRRRNACNERRAALRRQRSVRERGQLCHLLESGFVTSSTFHWHGNTKDNSEIRASGRRRLGQEPEARGISRSNSKHDLAAPTCTTIEPSRASRESSGRAQDVVITLHRTPIRASLFPYPVAGDFPHEPGLGQPLDVNAMSTSACNPTAFRELE